MSLVIRAAALSLCLLCACSAAGGGEGTDAADTSTPGTPAAGTVPPRSDTTTTTPGGSSQSTGSSQPAGPDQATTRRTTADGVHITTGPDDFEGTSSFKVQAESDDEGSATAYVPLPLDLDRGVDVVTWAGNGHVFAFLLTTSTGDGPEVTEVRLLRDGRLVDEVAPNDLGLAGVGGPGEPKDHTVVAVDGDGNTVATCARDPELDSLFICEES